MGCALPNELIKLAPGEDSMPVSGDKLNILVFPGGTEIGQEINKSLAECKNIKLYSANSSGSNHAPYVFHNNFNVQGVQYPSWLKNLNKIIIREKIDFVFPAHDDVIAAFAANIEKLKSKIISSPPKTCLITRSKSLTYRYLRDVIPVPKLFNNVNEIDHFPVFIKPDEGQGSIDTHIVKNLRQLESILVHLNNAIISEYLPGKEYTVDCFSDREKGLMYCGGRERLRTKSGISMNSKDVSNPQFLDFANRITSKLEFYGAWFFQLKEDISGSLKLLEIGPRIAGTMAVNRVKGVNFPLLSIFEQQRLQIEIMTNPLSIEIDRALKNSYKFNTHYETVYIDLDDTLIIKNQVNLKLIALLFQFINKKKKVVLITKHTGDLLNTLKTFRLENLFDEIIHLPISAEKSDFIETKNSIFIDDSFKERKAVMERCGVLTFDCSMIEMLQDERV